jgi:glycosyltransferase involved in cell wall biosynthesis
MLISLIHPSRGRAEKAMETLCYWIVNSSNDPSIQIEHITSVDEDDPQKQLYKSLLEGQSWVIINDNTNVVQATNKAAKCAKGDIIIYLSDDFKCPEDWDELLVSFFENVEIPMLLKVDDCLQKFSMELVTIPIMNRKLYEKLGYFWNPEYEGSFVDNDLYHVCKNNNWISLDSTLKFPHEHYSIGASIHDETYKKQDNNFESGKLIFQKRKQQKFPL